MAVGFRRQRQNHFTGVDCRVDLRAALADTFLEHFVVQLAEKLDLVIGVPADALATVTQLFEHRPKRAELLEGVRIVTLDNHHIRAVLAGDRCFACGLPVGAAKRLGQFAGAVVQHWNAHQILLDTQLAFGDFRELPGNRLVDIPVGP